MNATQSFSSRKAAHAYLLERGHELPYSTFVDACAGGKCQVEKNGKTILLSSLVNYIDQHLRQAVGGSVALAVQKAELEVDDLRARVKKRELENRKEDEAWMLRADHEEQVAAILGASQEMVRQRFDMDGGKILHALGGDTARLPELVGMLENVIDAAFNDLAGTHEFDVVFSAVGEE